MNVARLLLATAAMALVAVPAIAQAPSVSITFQNGYVSVNARNAPLRQILQEWARVGGTRIVNAERVTGAPITIELQNVPEQQAISTLLRGVSGFIVGARHQASTGPSAFDRILILPTSTASPTARVVAAPQPAPAPAAPVFMPAEPDDAQDPAGRPLTAQQMQNQIREANARAAAARGAADQDGVEAPDAPPPPPPPAPTNVPSNPFFSGAGSGRPGEITPVPQQPRNPLRPNGDPEP